MTDVITYKGLLITNPTPTGDGGAIIIENFKRIADQSEQQQSQIDTINTTLPSITAVSSPITINTIAPSANNFTFISQVANLSFVAGTDGRIYLRQYTPMTGSLSVTPNEAEVGQVLNSAQLNWSITNGPEITQSLNNGIGAISTGVRSYTHTTSISANRTYTLTAYDGTTTITPNASITFKLKRYWNTSTTSTDLLSSEIVAGSSELSTSRNKSITFNCTGGRYIFFAYPVSYGLATVRDANNFIFQDWRSGGVSSTTPYTVSITNLYGHVDSYYVYHSFNQYNSSTVTFNFA